MTKNDNSKAKYLGMENYNTQGYKMKISEYNKYSDIVVEFYEPYYYKTHSRTDRFISGNICNPYAPSLFGVGIVGNKYPTHEPGGARHTSEYLRWRNMLSRCYDKDSQPKNRTYYNIVTVCDEWKYFENFYEWLHEQENYAILNDLNNMAIDKDILVKGNKEYRPDRCCLVPQIINNIMLKSNAIRGDLPIGVCYFKRNNKYAAQCGGKANPNYLGLYSTPEEAFLVYKKFKESQIKALAKSEYEKGTIIKKCYDALMNYEVEIDD